MRKRFVLLLISQAGAFLVSFTNLYAQVAYEWHRLQESGEVVSFSSYAYDAIAKDALGHVYVVATGENVGNTIHTGIHNIITKKYNPDGSTDWSELFTTFVLGFPETHIYNIATAIAVSESGNVYVAMYTARDPEYTPVTGYIIRYDPDGNLLNMRPFTGFVPKAIHLDADENVYLAGTSYIFGSVWTTNIAVVKMKSDFSSVSFRSLSEFSNGKFSGLAVGGSGDLYVTGFISRSSTRRDFLTAKFNTTLIPLFTKIYHSADENDDEPVDIAVDAADNVYVTGFSGLSLPDYNYTTIKYNSVLDEQWVRSYDGSSGGANPEVGRAIVANNSGEVYVTGISGSAFATIKYNEAGEELWVRRFEDGRLANDMTMDESGNIYITGNGEGSGGEQAIIAVKYDAAGNQKWSLAYAGLGDFYEVANGLVVDHSGNVYLAGKADDADAIILKYSQCFLTCPGNITGSNKPGECGAIIKYPAAAATDACRSLTYSIPSESFFPVGTTTVTVSSYSGQENCSFDVIISDTEKPVITNSPANLTVTCASDIPAPDVTTVTATDNCSVVISHLSDVVSNQICASKFTVTRTYKATDPSGNSATCSQMMTVDDNVPPQINNLSLSQTALWPPNHKMQDITVNYTATDNCANNPIISISVSSNEPVNGTADGDTDPDWEIIDDHHVRLRAERAANGNGRIYTITVTIDDGCNPPVSQSKQVMVVHNITGPQSGKPFKIGSTVNFTGEFWDNPANRHTAKWLIDASTSIKGIVTEPAANKNGQVTGSYKFGSAGVYKLQMNITDQNGITSYANTNGDIDAIVVVYDPNGGHTYGGGYYNSPAGALKSDPSATGKASYGFAMNYFKNSTNPKGETQFEFKVGDFEFNALNFDYLVISNSMAQFKGTGKIIGGQSGIGFTMTVTDGQLDGSGIDKIRMKIYNKNNGVIIYDDQPGASDAALPAQAVGANSIIVISGTNSSLTSAYTNQKAEMEVNVAEVSTDLDVIAYPNPSINNFTITVKGNLKEKITMQVVDMYGRIIETNNVSANSMIRFGDGYRSGTYFVRIIQGKQHTELKLIKLSD